VILALQESCLQKLKKKSQFRKHENAHIKKFWPAKILKSGFQENKSSKKALGRFCMRPKTKGSRRSVTCRLLFKRDGTDHPK